MFKPEQIILDCWLSKLSLTDTWHKLAQFGYIIELKKLIRCRILLTSARYGTKEIIHVV